MNTLHSNWSWVKLGDVCEIIMGQSPPSSTYNTGKVGLPFFQGKAEFTELYPEVRKWCSKPKKIAEPFDILVSVRAPVGSTNIANQKCCIGRGLAAIRYQDCNKFIFYFFRLNEEELDKLGTGTTFRAISNKTLRELQIALPPLLEQKKIVEKIEELFSGLDSGVASLKKAKEQLRLYRQSVLAYAFSGRLINNEELIIKNESHKKSGESINPDNQGSDNLPEGWKWVKAEDICSSVRDGTHDTPKYVDNGFPLVTSKNLKNGEIDFIKTKNISEEDYFEISKRSKVDNGDVLFAMIGTIGNPVVVNTKREFSIKNVGLFKKNESDFNSYYLKYWLESNSLMKKLDDLEMIKGTTQKFIPLCNLRTLPIPIPPNINVQTQIVEEIESRFAGSEALEKAIDASLTKAEALRQSILKQAFEGRLI